MKNLMDTILTNVSKLTHRTSNPTEIPICSPFKHTEPNHRHLSLRDCQSLPQGCLVSPCLPSIYSQHRSQKENMSQMKSLLRAKPPHALISLRTQAQVLTMTVDPPGLVPVLSPLLTLCGPLYCSSIASGRLPSQGLGTCCVFCLLQSSSSYRVCPLLSFKSLLLCNLFNVAFARNYLNHDFPTPPPW